MTNQHILSIYGERLKNGQFFIRGEESGGKPMTVAELQRHLLSAQTPSSYGSKAQPASFGAHSGLILSPGLALDYLANPGLSLLEHVKWSPELVLLRKVAAVYSAAIADERFAPSFAKWRMGYFGWKLQLPQTDAALHRGLLADGERLGIFYLQDWFNDALQEILQRDEAVTAHPKALQVSRRMDNSPLMLGLPDNYEWVDEQQWLVAIGWKEDDLPYRICIQLREPATEEHTFWILRLVLQDKERPERFVQTDSLGSAINGTLPVNWSESVRHQIRKDIERISRMIPLLHSNDPSMPVFAELDDEQAWEFLSKSSSLLIEAGIVVMLPGWWQEVSARKPKVKGKVQRSYAARGSESMLGLNQIIQFDWRVAVGDVELSEAEFTKLANDKRQLIRIRGKWIHLDEEWLMQVQDTLKRVNKHKGLALREILAVHMRESESAGNDSDSESAFAAEDMELDLDPGLDELIAHLDGKSALQKVPQPKQLHGDLRQYQLEGVSWLLFLRRYGIGGCLADDMGLGKTIQFIAYLLHTHPAQAPALLVCPTSVLGNWQKELERFAPSLRVHLHYGPHRAKGQRFRDTVKDYDLVLTSYALSSLDRNELGSIEWDCICLDEAQNIKNAYTKQASAIRRLEGGHRIALTGTPIENRLAELWSIMDFLNPGYLGSLPSFNATYVNPIEKAKDTRQTARLQQLVRPFLMRRVKKDPAIQLDLPDKNELKTYVSLTAEQGALYENVVRELFEQLGSVSGIGKKGLILASLTKLKQICDHPALFLKEKGRLATPDRSNKTVRLVEMVRELRQEGESCLIFTQYVDMGHLLQNLLMKEFSEQVLFLHGGIAKSKRDEMIERFQGSSDGSGDTGGIFILSLKAGGTGLNLTAANHVFHYDRWWNPAVENQATDRAFRIGQTRDVQVHKFVTLGTLEERIDGMIEQKQGLSRQIVGSGENWITEMTTDELKDLFALRKQWIEE